MEHLNVFNRCINDLLRVEVEYEEDKALLLRSLLPSFKHFRTTVMFGKETFQFEKVVQDIISHVKINKSSGDDMKSEGLLVKGSNNYRDRSKERGGKSDNRGRSKSRSRKDVECYYAARRVTSRRIVRSSKPISRKKRSSRTLQRLELQRRTKQNFFWFHQVNRSQIHGFLILVVPSICVQTGIGLTHTRRRMEVKSSWGTMLRARSLALAR